MDSFGGWLSLIGAVCFGIVIGWVTYRSLRFATMRSGVGTPAMVDKLPAGEIGVRHRAILSHEGKGGQQ